MGLQAVSKDCGLTGSEQRLWAYIRPYPYDLLINKAGYRDQNAY